ncbi:MAG: isoprenyl transferase [Cellvibrionales bacterium]|nr:isoprenyl transferase [Cellvibrionales bacterium]
MPDELLPPPKHIAIVMDGNGRWAKKRHLPAAAGHKAGAENVRDILESARHLGVKALTLFAFSTENWNRPKLEVKALMALFSDYLDGHIDELKKAGVRLRFIGARDKFQAALLKKIEYAEQETSANEAFTLTLAVDYGGQWDILNAAKSLAKKSRDGLIDVDTIDETAFEAELSLNDIDYPDLLIRTSGEYRISNFLLWQLAYSEFYFTDILWPDFKQEALTQAVESYRHRDRRFGGREE